MKFVEIIAPPSRYPPAGECAPACLASTGGGLVLLGHAQARPHAFRTKERFQFGIDALNLVTIAVLLFANCWIVLKSARLAPQALSSALERTNSGIRDSLGIDAWFTGLRGR